MENVYACSNCSFESPFYLADCPECGRGFFNLKAAAQARTSYGGAAGVAAQPAAAGETRVCYKCDHETREPVERCPRCGNRRVLTTKGIRALGGVLVALGLFLVTFMGAISVIVAGIIIRSSDPAATTRFDGGTKEIALIFGIFGLVIAFGAACTVGGAMQLARGRRSKTMVRVVMGIFFAIIVVAEIIYVVLD
ncbi:MAG TPA: hypothetical protein VN228_15410 [Pyrinomonadaceae bacterium]|nr:hypothetical protein [Pyrinomonadaceae bacterium]